MVLCGGDASAVRASRAGDSGSRGCAPRSTNKGVRSPPSADAALLMANPVSGRRLSHSSWRPLALARSVSLMTPLVRSVLVFLW